MRDTRSPIARMIDEATGFDPSMLPDKAWVTLRCPDCGSSQRTTLAPLDPPQAVEVVCTCPDCVVESCVIEFYDKRGNRLPYNVPDEDTPPNRPTGRSD